MRLARLHFGLDRLGIELVLGDALEHLRRERRSFDLIVEDLFVGPSRSRAQARVAPRGGLPADPWAVAPGGYVVSNTIHEMPDVVRAMRPFGGRIVSLDVRGHWNRVTVCGRALPPPRALRRVLAARPETARILGRVALRRA